MIDYPWNNLHTNKHHYQVTKLRVDNAYQPKIKTYNYLINISSVLSQQFLHQIFTFKGYNAIYVNIWGM